ncbi:MAG: carbohydrate porin [Tepidisphaeraceae bacterium]
MAALAVVVASLTIEGEAFAQQQPASGPVDSTKVPQDLPPQPAPQLDPLISPDPLGFAYEPWNAFKKKLNDDYGLKIEGSYTFHNQYATRVIDGGRNDELGGRLDLAANWTLLKYGDGPKQDVGQLIVLMRSSENIGMRQDYAVSDAAGSIMGTNSLHGGGEQIPISLNLLYWRQTFMNQKFAVNIGKIHPNSWIDLSPIANDETKQFMAGAYTGNLANPGQGLWVPGVAFEYNIDEHWYANLVVANNEGRTGTSGLDGEWNFYEAAEVGYKVGGANQPDTPPGNYRLTVYHNDSDDGNGWGMSLGFDQEIADGWTPFGRVGHVERDAGYISDFVSFGVANVRPFGRRADMFGIAGTYSRPSDRDLREELLFETFYRVKVTENLEFSPDVQWINHPALQPDVDNLFVLGARLKILF